MKQKYNHGKFRRQVKEMNKAFRNNSSASIDVPKRVHDFPGLTITGLPDVQDNPAIKGTYTTSSGEVKDLRDMPSFIEMLHPAIGV